MHTGASFARGSVILAAVATALAVGLSGSAAIAAPAATTTTTTPDVTAPSVTHKNEAGTHSIAYAIGTTHHRLDRNGGDFDITASLVSKVLANKPDSLLAQLNRRNAAGMTCFFPTDAAYAKLVNRLKGTRHRTERMVFSAVVRVGLTTHRGSRFDTAKVERFLADQCLRTSNGAAFALPAKPGTRYVTLGLSGTSQPAGRTLSAPDCQLVGTPDTCPSDSVTFRDESPATPDATITRVKFRSLASTQRVFALSHVQGTTGISLAAAGATCAQGGVCALGDTGPGGGIVYYVAPALQSWGQYLEVAPNGWNGNTVDCNGGCGGTGAATKTSDAGQAGAGTGRGYEWCNSSGVQLPIFAGGTGIPIGTGEENTTLMVSNCAASTPEKNAGNLARSYTGGGMPDWALPSLEELAALYSYPNRDAIGGFAASNYWTSTYYGTGVDEASAVNFSNGSDNSLGTGKNFNVRPIRVF